MGIEKKYDVIVVGGGLAGLTAGAYTSKDGLSTLVIEMGEKTGGLVNSFVVDGFHFDGGIRAFENSGIIFPMLKELGIKLDFVKNPVSIGVEDHFLKLGNKESIFEYNTFLKELFPEDQSNIDQITNQIEKVMGYMDVLYGIDNPLFVDVKNDKEYLFKTLLPWLFKYSVNIKKAKKLNKPINDYMKEFTTNQVLIDMITQHFFKETPSFFALSYFSLYLDYSYPLGGTGVLAKKVSEFIESKNGEILLNTKAEKIDVKSKTIETNAGQKFSYGKLIWSADMKFLYDSINYENEKIKSHKELIKKNKGGDSVFSLFIGIDIDKAFFEKTCGPHLFYTPVKEGLSSISKELLYGTKEWIKEYLRLTTYEISCPVLRDESLAPFGKSGIIISTLLDYEIVRRASDEGWYSELKQLCETEIINILENSIFKGFKDKIIFKSSSTPLTVERITGNLGGAITGWSFETEKIPSENRFPKIQESVNTFLPDVYQAGQWTFSPSGLPVSILTGRLAAREVLKK